MAKWTKGQEDDAARRLAALDAVRRGARYYTVLRSVSRSGMSRTMTVHVVHGGALHDVTRAVAVLTGNGEDRHGNLRIQGAGMDMGFAVVYSLSHALTGDGYALKQAWA